MPKKGQFVSPTKWETMVGLFIRACSEQARSPSPALQRTIDKWEALLVSLKPANDYRSI